jgi:hypothetical protein
MTANAGTIHGPHTTDECVEARHIPSRGSAIRLIAGDLVTCERTEMRRSIASISVSIDEVCPMGLAQDSYGTTERRNVQSVLSLLILSPAVIPESLSLVESTALCATEGGCNQEPDL